MYNIERKRYLSKENFILNFENEGNEIIHKLIASAPLCGILFAPYENPL